MPLQKISPGKNVPSDINVVIEIPAYSSPVKYEVDKASGALIVDRFMGTAMQYPCNYGYIPRSLSNDGDPADVLVISPDPLLSGCVVRCRPIGVLKMTDEAGEDAKILAVPLPELTPFYDKIRSYKDISEAEIARITHFFGHYKDLEKDKWVKIEGWFGIEETYQEINDSIARYQTEPV